MKLLKKIIAITLCSTIMMSQMVCASKKYGFSYNEKVYTKVQFGEGAKLKVYNGKDLIGIMTHKVGRMVNKEKVEKNVWENTIVCKINMKPYQNENAKKYGVSEYCSSKMLLPSKDYNDWSPENKVPEDKWTIGVNAGVGAGGDKSFGVSATTDIKNARLEEVSEIHSENYTAEFKYDYKPYKTINPFDQGKNKNVYFRTDSTQYCMVSINTKKYSWIKFDFKANFTYSKEKNCKPANVVIGAIDGEISYTWTF